MIQAIIFDFGNVIYEVHRDRFVKAIARFTETPARDLDLLIYGALGPSHQYETGLISSNEFFKKIESHGYLTISKEEFFKAFNEMFVPIPATLHLIRQLKPHYTLCLLSNTNESHFENTIQNVEVYDLFDHVTLSFEVKAMKPSKKIYQDALKKLKMKPDACVFIDDVKEYADAASDMGMRGVQYTSHDQLLTALRELGVNTVRA
jgi:putative hydrolase of the HAD superfamily